MRCSGWISAFRPAGAGAALVLIAAVIRPSPAASAGHLAATAVGLSVAETAGPSAAIALRAATSAAEPGPDLAREDEVIAQPVTELSCGASPAAAFSRGGWHVVWAGEGDIWARSHDLFGWRPPVRLSSDPAPSRDPHIAAIDHALLVIWEDERTGRPEIWSRRWNGAEWEAEVCLSDDASPSRRPAIAGHEDAGFVVWDDGPVGSRTVLGRPVQGGQWGAVEPVGAGPAEEFEPSIDLDLASGSYLITWTDTRSGSSEIYDRTRSASGPYYDPPVRLSSTPGACGRSSVRAGRCCGDVIYYDALVAYENDNGTPEVYTVCWHGEYGNDEAVRVSPDDGFPSRGPCAAAFNFGISMTCGMLGGEIPAYYGAWSDETPEGVFRHSYFRSFDCPHSSAPLSLPDSRYGGVQLAAAPGHPYAQLIALWIEDRDGVPSLTARRSTTPGCSHVEIVPPRFALLSPGSGLSTTVLARNECGSAPVPGVHLRLDFSDCSGITWDALQPHPISEQLTTNAEGEAAFHLRGGGCVRDCRVDVLCEGGPWVDFVGVRSPDVDGDCAVREDDRVYVASRLGTSDYCADLDGSGWVDEEDLAIVDQTMGESCSQISGVTADRKNGAGLSLRIHPNPSHGPVRISLRAGRRAADPAEPGFSGATCQLLIADAAGRLVRRYDLRPPDPSDDPGTAEILWDTRDARGRLVASGVYLATVRGERELARRALIVLR